MNQQTLAWKWGRATWLGLLVLFAVLFALGTRCDLPAAEVEARWAQPPSRFVDVDGLRTHYRDRGHGPVVVLLHGSNASLFTWEGWTSALSTDHRVIALDLPGHGLTGPDPRARYAPREMADFLDRFLAELGIEHIILAGNSMGGGVAWRYAILHPEKVDRLLLVDATGFPREEPMPFGLRAYSAPVLGYLARWFTPRFLVACSVRDVYADPTRVTDTLIGQYDDFLLRDGNREATRRRLSLLADDGLLARIGDIRAPTLILWGTRDTWTHPKYGERFHAAIRDSRLVLLDGLGHVPMEEDPAASLAPVRTFLGK